MLASGASTPSIAQIQAGTDASDSAATASGSITASSTSVVASAVVDSGLSASTTYDVVMVAQDASGNVQATSRTFSVFTVLDSSAPAFVSGYPIITAVTDHGVELVAQLDEAGSVYWVVLADGSSSPSVSQLMAGQDGDSSAGVASGAIAVTAATTNATHTLASLSPSTAYDVWWVAEDDEPTPNVQVSAVKLDVTTSVDATPPVFSTGFPVTSAHADERFTIEVQADEAGVWKFVVLPNGAAVPSTTMVFAGLAADGSAAVASGGGTIAAAGSTVTSLVQTGLHASTAYDVYVAAEDNTGNRQAAAVRLDTATTTDATPPVFAAGPSTVAGAATDRSITVNAALNEAGSVFVVVLAQAATSPSAAQVEAGTDGGGGASLASGSFDVTDASGWSGSLALTELTASTAFDVWFVAKVGVLGVRRVRVRIHVSVRCVCGGSWSV